MRNLFYIGFLMFGLLSSGFAGDKVGNGGASVVCRHPHDFSVQFSQPLDRWEGSNIYSLEILDLDSDFLDQIKVATSFFESYSKAFHPQFSDFLKTIREAQVNLPASIGLRLTDDVYDKEYYSKELDKWILVKNHNENLLCRVELAAHYDSQTLKVDREIVNAYSQTDLAILYTHETLLEMAKKMAINQNAAPIQNSSEVRELVAQIFSKNKNWKRIDFLIRKLFWIDKKYGGIEPVVKLNLNLKYRLKYCEAGDDVKIRIKIKLYNMPYGNFFSRKLENSYLVYDMYIHLKQEDFLKSVLVHEVVIPTYAFMGREGGYLLIEVADEQDLIQWVTSKIDQNVANISSSDLFLERRFGNLN